MGKAATSSATGFQIMRLEETLQELVIIIVLPRLEGTCSFREQQDLSLQLFLPSFFQKGQLGVATIVELEGSDLSFEHGICRANYPSNCKRQLSSKCKPAPTSRSSYASSCLDEAILNAVA